MRIGRFGWLLVAALAGAIALGAACKKQDEASGPAAVAPGEAEAWYRCPMPEDEFWQQGPGRCPKCGMNLERAPEGWTPPAGEASSADEPAAPPPVETPAAEPATVEIKTARELAPERIGEQATCPIGGDTFQVVADTPAVEWNDQVRLFGCMGSARAFAANPESPAPPPCARHRAQ